MCVRNTHRSRGSVRKETITVPTALASTTQLTIAMSRTVPRRAELPDGVTAGLHGKSFSCLRVRLWAAFVM